MHSKILIFDFGSQYTQLIARRLREINIYCEIHPYNKLAVLEKRDFNGIILSGSPFSVLQDDALQFPVKNVLEQYKTPLLGICYGAQYLAHIFGGRVEKSSKREYGRAHLDFIEKENLLFKGIEKSSQVWMSHGDSVLELPTNFELLANTDSIPVAGFKIKEQEIYGIQFHPEVTHSQDGMQLLKNFALDICGCKTDWTPLSFIDETVEDIKKQVGNDKVVLGLSGGVDSSVAALLLHKSIGNQLVCIFVNNGLLRYNEYESVLESYKHLGLNIKGVDASEQFY
ncbi:MAG: glutamine-hydrolyzing GMP synthase, partial [Bacteroidetes bacterium]|nr:glutamine-hydrolyzing GMP synthase [Bacteroidota bacterium]